MKDTTVATQDDTQHEVNIDDHTSKEAPPVKWIDVPSGAVLFVGLSYCVISGAMMVINKASLAQFPYPNTLMALQFLASAILVRIMGLLKIVEVTELKVDIAIAFLPAVSVFYLNIFANFQALSLVNVDTLIVFRSCVPLLVALGDFLFLNRSLPDRRTWLSLIIVAGSTAMFFWHEVPLKFIEWVWCMIYFVLIGTDMLLLKHISDTVSMTTFSRVYYNNFIAAIFASVNAAVHNEVPDYLSLSPWAISIVIISCIAGLGLSWAGWAFRAKVSALSFTVVGVLCKLGTVLLNTMVWQKHGSTLGVFMVISTIFGACLYKQPPARESSGPVDTKKQTWFTYFIIAVLSVVVLGTGGFMKILEFKNVLKLK